MDQKEVQVDAHNKRLNSKIEHVFDTEKNEKIWIVSINEKKNEKYQNL